jgi:ABC-2 type transport system ATP-binding protein
MEEAQRLCDRVAIVDHGKLLALDSVDGLVASHGGSSVVEAEIKSSPENINLPGRVEDNSLRFESEKPLEEVARLTGQGVQFQTLRIAQPDLESVFLSLTGRSLRD